MASSSASSASGAIMSAFIQSRGAELTAAQAPFCASITAACAPATARMPFCTVFVVSFHFSRFGAHICSRQKMFHRTQCRAAVRESQNLCQREDCQRGVETGPSSGWTTVSTVRLIRRIFSHSSSPQFN